MPKFKVVTKLILDADDAKSARKQVLDLLVDRLPPDWEFTMFETRLLRQKGRVPKRISTH